MLRGSVVTTRRVDCLPLRLTPEGRRARITLVFPDTNPSLYKQTYDFYCFWLVVNIRSLEIYIFKQARSEFLPVIRVVRSKGSRHAGGCRYQTEHERQPASDDCTDNRPDIHRNQTRDELPHDNHLKDSVESERKLSLEQRYDCVNPPNREENGSPGAHPIATSSGLETNRLYEKGLLIVESKP